MAHIAEVEDSGRVAVPVDFDEKTVDFEDGPKVGFVPAPTNQVAGLEPPSFVRAHASLHLSRGDPDTAANLDGDPSRRDE